MNLLMLILVGALAGDRTVQWPCPSSWSATRDAVMRDLEDSLSRMEPGAQEAWCEQSSEVGFLAVAEDWDSDPSDRLTRAFVLCKRAGAEATWARVVYFRSWPAGLAPSSPERKRRLPKRLGTPHVVEVEGGTFPPTAMDDLQGWLDVLGFWELPSESPRDSAFVDTLGVRVVRAWSRDRENAIVGGEYCSPLPTAIDFLAQNLMNEPDPVAFLASYRERLRKRRDEGRDAPPGP